MAAPCPFIVWIGRIVLFRQKNGQLEYVCMWGISVVRLSNLKDPSILIGLLRIGRFLFSHCRRGLAAQVAMSTSASVKS